MIRVTAQWKAYRENAGIAWARLVSDILSPPVIWAALAFPISFRDAPSTATALMWALIYIVLVCVLPILYIAINVKRGKITDIHMRLRQQRIRPFIVSIICTTIAWWTLRFLGAPPFIPQFVLFSLIQLAVIGLITLVWQVSIHAMSISGAMMATGFLYGPLGALLVAPLIVLVCRARLKLKRHTMAQVVVGSLLGITIPVLMLALGATW